MMSEIGKTMRKNQWVAQDEDQALSRWQKKCTAIYAEKKFSRKITSKIVKQFSVVQKVRADSAESPKVKMLGDCKSE